MRPLRRELDDAEERRVADGGHLGAVEVVDPDLLSGVQARRAGRVARLVARVLRRRVGAGADRVDARPALDERRVVDHHTEPDARCRVVVQ